MNATLEPPPPFGYRTTAFGPPVSSNMADLLRLGVEAIETCEAQEGYRIVLSEVHTPVSQPGDPNELAGVMVNMVGALLATNGFPPRIAVSHTNLVMALSVRLDPSFTEVDAYRLRQLTFIGVGLVLPDNVRDFAPTPYLHDPDQWKADMLTLADYYQSSPSFP